MLGYTPPGPEADTPLGPEADIHPRQTSPFHSACWDMVNKWTVHIPLECIFVFIEFTLLDDLLHGYSYLQVHCTSVRVHQPSHSDVHDHNEHAGVRRADEEEHEEPHQPAAVRHGAQ